MTITKQFLLLMFLFLHKISFCYPVQKSNSSEKYIGVCFLKNQNFSFKTKIKQISKNQQDLKLIQSRFIDFNNESNLDKKIIGYNYKVFWEEPPTQEWIKENCFKNGYVKYQDFINKKISTVYQNMPVFISPFKPKKLNKLNFEMKPIFSIEYSNLEGQGVRNEFSLSSAGVELSLNYSLTSMLKLFLESEWHEVSFRSAEEPTSLNLIVNNDIGYGAGLRFKAFKTLDLGLSYRTLELSLFERNINPTQIKSYLEKFNTLNLSFLIKILNTHKRTLGLIGNYGLSLSDAQHRLYDYDTKIFLKHKFKSFFIGSELGYNLYKIVNSNTANVNEINRNQYKISFLIGSRF